MDPIPAQRMQPNPEALTAACFTRGCDGPHAMSHRQLSNSVSHLETCDPGVRSQFQETHYGRASTLAPAEGVPSAGPCEACQC